MTSPHSPPRVVQFLRDGGTLDDLTARYAIKVTRARAHPELALLKYNQVESPMGDPIVQECRGIILDTSRDHAVVSRSFDKFFNHGEGHAAPIDWSTAAVQEKLDGSLTVLYHHDGAWRVQSSGSPDASGDINRSGMLFSTLFWQTFAAHGWSLPPDEDRDLCFAFELMSPLNQVVVRHASARLCLLAVRDRLSGAEVPLDACARYGYDLVRRFPLQSLRDIEDSFATMAPLAQEGYVIVDGGFRRVKVKHPGYVALHQLKAEFSPRRLLEVVRSGETSEVLTYFPEWRRDLEDVTSRFEGLVAQLEADYARLRGIAVQKDFALEAVKTRCSAALFAVRSGKAPSIRRYLAETQIDALMKILRLRDDAPTAITE